MNKLFYLLALTVQISFSQDISLMQSWIMNGAFDCSGREIDASEETHWNVIFKPDGFASIIVDKNLKTEKSFTVSGNNIKMPTVSYEILKITPDSLMLLNNKERCVKYSFLSESANEKRKTDLLKSMNFKSFMYMGDTVYFATNNNSPKIKGYSSYHEYFGRAFPHIGKTEGCLILFQFIVSKNGEILNPKGSISCLNDDSKQVSKIIDGMKNIWEPMQLDGKPVNALMRIRYTHGGVTLIKQ
jgi:hypothetical protein